ncbi:MAG: hypothetical protein V1754_12250, partial [Pseudomonadota bacterium]
LEFKIRIFAKGADVQELEITVGAPPENESSATLVRKKGCRGKLLRWGRGPKVPFSSAFVLRDQGGQICDLLNAGELHESLEKHIHGGLGLWSGEGVRYFARPLEGGWPVPIAEIVFSAQDASTEDLAELVAVCVSIAQQIKAPS